MTLQEAIALFIEDGRVRELASNTLKSYRFHLDRFAHWCEYQRLTEPREIALEHILAFRRSLDARKSPSGRETTITYRNRHVRAVRLLFRLLYKRGLILANIAARLPEYHDEKRLPRNILDKDQVMKLLQSAHLTTPTGFRDRAIFEVLYSTGIRGAELCKLTLYDLTLAERLIRINQGKGHKDRVVPIGKVAASYLAEYLKTVRPILLACSSKSAICNQKSAISTVFLTSKGEPFTTLNLRQQFNLHRDRAKLPDTITVHSLRHSCATEMLKGGASIRHVQELLGHADIATTQIYMHVVQTDLKIAHARTSPSERRQPVTVPPFDPVAPSWNDNRNAQYWPIVHGQKNTKPHEINMNKTRKRKRTG